MAHRFSRRNFVQKTTLLGAGITILNRSSLVRAYAANEKLNVAVVGVANRGGANLNGVSKENIVALCDVDKVYLGKAAQRFESAKTFADFRRMLDAVAPQIDAVVVSTPDHTHAVAGCAALRLGKHLYCEKPLAHDVGEVRLMTDLAREKKRATQLGTQIHAGENYRRVVELVQSGAIGKVAEVHVWNGAGYSGGDRPKETPPVPENLDWDLWLGPAPERPYHPNYAPFKWRGWWDFGTGGLGDFFCHYSDLPFWALDLKYPTSVETEGPPVHPESCCPWIIVRYEFPARGDRPAVRYTWYGGGKKPPFLAERKIPEWGAAVLFVGERGMILADYNRRMMLPQEQFKDFQPPPQTIPASIGHHQEWIDACKQGTPTTCRFDYSGPLSEAALLGVVSYRTGEKLNWDGPNMKAVNCPKADSFLHPPCRKGWSL